MSPGLERIRRPFTRPVATMVTVTAGRYTSITLRINKGLL